jgi:hypothetical protein
MNTLSGRAAACAARPSYGEFTVAIVRSLDLIADSSIADLSIEDLPLEDAA